MEARTGVWPSVSLVPDLRVLDERPLFPMAVYLCLGVASCTALPVSAVAGLLFVALLFGVLVLSLLKKWNKTLSLLLFCFALGYTLACAALPAWAGDPWAPEGPVQVSGLVVEVSKTSSGRDSFLLDGVTVDGQPVPGRVALTAGRGPGQCREGDALMARAELIRPRPSLYYGGFNLRGWYMRHGVRFTGFAPEVSVLPSGRMDTVLDLPEMAREYASGVLYRYLSPDSAALVSALLSGDTGGIREQTRRDFVDLGVAHLLAVSGLNISLTAGAAWLLCRKLRLPMPLSLAASFLVMAVYVLFAGLTPSVVRAAAMWAVAMGALVFARRYDPLSSLAAAAILILAVNPLDLFDAGFQLSFAATAAMFLWVAPLLRHAPDKKWMKSFLGAVGVTVCVTLMALPIILCYFNNVSLISPLANLVLVPASFVMQLAGTALVFIGFLPDAASLLGGMLDGYTQFYLRNVSLLSQAASTLPAATPPAWLCAAYAALVLLASPSVARFRPGGRAAVLVLVAVAAAVMLSPASSALTWQSDAAIIPEGSSSLSVCWRLNGQYYAACRGDSGELRGYLASRGISRLEGLYVLDSGPPDGGVLVFEGRLGVGRLYVPDAWLDDPAAVPFLEKASAMGMETLPAGSGPFEYLAGEGVAGVLIIPASGGRLAYVPVPARRGAVIAQGAFRGADVLVLGGTLKKPEEQLQGLGGMRLVLPGAVAPGGLQQYNIVDTGSIEVENRGGGLALVPWLEGWANGIQGNFR